MMELKHREELVASLKEVGSGVLNVYASWAEPCVQMNEVFDTLAKTRTSTSMCFVKINAEANVKLMVELKVSAVPTFLMLRYSEAKEGFIEAGRVEGADAPGLNRAVEAFVNGDVINPTVDLEDRIKQLIGNKTILFMKGEPTGPKCKFSRAIVNILNEEGIAFDHFDILTDEAIRQGLKEYSKWPTFPQLYSKGELIGGVDVVRELVENGELKAELGIPEGKTLDERLKALLQQEKTMLFMKGTPDQPRCGFSKKIVALLNDNGISYGSFDILSDEDVRQGLKVYSNWPTYPQLYNGGELIGGVDVVEELVNMGELKSELS